MKNLKSILGVFAMLAFVSCEKDEIIDGDVANNGNKEAVTNGLGGSMSQFIVIDDYLYTVDYKTLNVFHLADATNPVLLESIDMGIGMETVFAQNDNLFIGAQDGVHIYDISNPRAPEEVSEFEHVTSCDPVIANDEIAIATLRGGTECGGSLTELDIIDISDITNPELIRSESLINPYGLGFSKQNSNLVYVCDGYAGLKAYDLSDEEHPELVMELENLEAIDVIEDDNSTLIVLTRGGIYQYDCSDPLNLVEKSAIYVQ